MDFFLNSSFLGFEGGKGGRELDDLSALFFYQGYVRIFLHLHLVLFF